MKKYWIAVPALCFAIPFTCSPLAFAVKAIDLNHQRADVLQNFVPTLATAGNPNFEEINRSIDFNNTLHIRLKETYLGYPVWGGEALVHIPHGSQNAKSLGQIAAATKTSNGSMDGLVYQDIKADLSSTKPIVFDKQQAEKAAQSTIANYQQRVGNTADVSNSKSQLIVYIDNANKAHWAFHITFKAEGARLGIEAKPAFIVDAITFKPYQEWNDFKTVKENALGGGFGGNEKMGKLVYDGLADHLPKLKIKRDPDTKTCYLENDEVAVFNIKKQMLGVLASYACNIPDVEHDNVYWDGAEDEVNGGYSPSNDALFGGSVIKEMYQKWYGVPVLTDKGKPMLLKMKVHYAWDNAGWDGESMIFGDGITKFYPLTSIGVTAHEVSHGFTEQHSNLVYYGQSGGMNESFSDMAAQAAEFFVFGKNSWQLGPEIVKGEGALRYMDVPHKDCESGKEPGQECSIDDASQYHGGIGVHYSSGVYNHFFYLLATTPEWDTKKAFDVMFHANANYWTNNTDFERGACGVLKATKDLSYDVAAVKKAFEGVLIDVSKC